MQGYRDEAFDVLFLLFGLEFQDLRYVDLFVGIYLSTNGDRRRRLRPPGTTTPTVVRRKEGRPRMMWSRRALKTPLLVTLCWPQGVMATTNC
ncbi:hypothetical protein GQ457_12G012840 [Hibiscus cannabinus]